MDKGALLTRRVWQLFSDAGFQTKPNFTDGNEHVIKLSPKLNKPIDLYAWDDDLKVKIIGSNKAGDLKSSWSGHVDECEELRKIGKFNKLLFVVTEKKLSEGDYEYARSKNAEVWALEQLTYYEALVDTLGKYAKYELLHNLGIKTKEEDISTDVLALRTRQPTSDSDCELFTFTLSPEKLLKTCVVYRKALDASGNAAKAYQRMINKKRLPKIAEFVSQTNALLPVNIIVHLTDDVEVTPLKMDDLKSTHNSKIKFVEGKSDLVRLHIPMRYASLEIIDGQHRLFGFSKCAYQEIKNNYNLVVLGIRGLDEATKTKSFVAINDNSRRMDPNLVSCLKYTNDENACKADSELMAIKIVHELNKRFPFLDKIRLTDVGDHRITLKGFSGYDLQGLVGDKGFLRKYYSANSSKEYLAVLRIYFSAIRETFKMEWNNPDKYIIATNRGISAFLKLLKSILKVEEKQLDQEIINKYLKALKSNWNGPWETSLLKEAYVGSQGWKRLYLNMVKAIRHELKSFK